MAQLSMEQTLKILHMVFQIVQKEVLYLVLIHKDIERRYCKIAVVGDTERPFSHVEQRRHNE